LEAEKEEACDGGKHPQSCNGLDCDLNVIQQKISNRNACISKRLEVMFTCFKGGDGRHWGKVEQELKGLAKCKNCLNTALGNQCRK
jgi:hypothetical protein